MDVAQKTFQEDLIHAVGDYDLLREWPCYIGRKNDGCKTFSILVFIPLHLAQEGLLASTTLFPESDQCMCAYFAFPECCMTIAHMLNAVDALRQNNPTRKKLIFFLDIFGRYLNSFRVTCGIADYMTDPSLEWIKIESCGIFSAMLTFVLGGSSVVGGGSPETKHGCGMDWLIPVTHEIMTSRCPNLRFLSENVVGPVGGAARKQLCGSVLATCALRALHSINPGDMCTVRHLVTPRESTVTVVKYIHWFLRECSSADRADKPREVNAGNWNVIRDTVFARRFLIETLVSTLQMATDGSLFHDFRYNFERKQYFGVFISAVHELDEADFIFETYDYEKKVQSELKVASAFFKYCRAISSCLLTMPAGNPEGTDNRNDVVSSQLDGAPGRPCVGSNTILRQGGAGGATSCRVKGLLTLVRERARYK